MDGDGGVGDQGPRRRRPDEQVVGPAHGREAHVDARVDDVGVAHRDLVVGEGGLAARAVRRDPVVLHQQALVPDRLQAPPDGLDVAGVHRAVGAGQVRPVAHPLGEPLELIHVAQHRLAALLVECGDPVGLDVLLAVEAELLLDGELDGQAVAVPARPARDVVALHRLEAREKVLEDAGLDVVGPRLAVGRRRTFVEDPARTLRGLHHRAIEDGALVPAGEDLRLQRGQVGRTRRQWPERRGGHPAGCSFVGRPAKGRGRFPAGSLPAPRYHPPWPADPHEPTHVRGPGLPRSGCIPSRLFRQLRGDLHAGPASGLTPSPDRSWLLPALLVPVRAAFRAGVRIRGLSRATSDPVGCPDPRQSRSATRSQPRGFARSTKSILRQAAARAFAALSQVTICS